MSMTSSGLMEPPRSSLSILEPQKLLDEVLEDLECRFIINAPDEDYESTDRIMFDIEAAQWFYVDILVPEYNLPAMMLKSFTQKIFQHCPALREHTNVNEIITSWGLYKKQVPVRGAIILNSKMDKVLLVKGIGSNVWNFPGGKVNRNESDIDCALREVREETNCDLSSFLSDQAYLEAIVHQKPYKMYVAVGFPEQHDFRPLTKGEIEMIQWFSLSDLPPFSEPCQSKYSEKHFYVVDRFGAELRRWVKNKKQHPKGQSKLRSKKVTNGGRSVSTKSTAVYDARTATTQEVPTHRFPCPADNFSNFQLNHQRIMKCFDQL